MTTERQTTAPALLPWIVFAAFVAWAGAITVGVLDPNPRAQEIVLANLRELPVILSHVPRNAAQIPWLALTLFSCIGVGDFLLKITGFRQRDIVDRALFGATVGWGLLRLIAFVLAAAHLLAAPIIVTLYIVGSIWSAVALFSWRRLLPLPDLRQTARPLMWLLWFALGLNLYLCLLGALEPEVNFDARVYHLTQAYRYAQHGGFYDIVASTGLLIFAFPHYQEALYAQAWAVSGVTDAKLIAVGDVIVIAFALIAFSRVWLSSTGVGLLAAVLMLSTPTISWSASTASNDLPSAFLIVLIVHGLLSWLNDGKLLSLAMTGAFVGLQYGIKPFGALVLVVLLTLVIALSVYKHMAWRTILWNSAMICVAAGLVAVPALIAAFLLTKDPLFPLAPHLFPMSAEATKFVDLFQAMATSHSAGLNPINLALVPWRMTFDPGNYRDIVGPIWLIILPVALLIPLSKGNGARPVLRFLLLTASMLAVAFVLAGIVEFRYSMMTISLVALIVGYAALCWDWGRFQTTQYALGAALAVGIVMGSQLLSPLQRAATPAVAVGVEYLNWDYLYNGQDERRVQLITVPILEYVDAHLNPRTDKIYDDAVVWLMGMYSSVELYAASDGMSHVETVDLYSNAAVQGLKALGCNYVLVSITKVPSLRRAPLWRHLHLVDQAPAPIFNDQVMLFRVDS